MQARAEGIQLGSKHLAEERLVRLELERALDRRKRGEQALQEQQAAAALQAAAHVVSLEQHIQELKVWQHTASGSTCMLQVRGHAVSAQGNDVMLAFNQ